MSRTTLPVRHEATGVIHCHSSYSDGMESIPVILSAANHAGLDFLLMTDHNTIAPLAEFGEQWSGKTLLLLGCEVTPRHNHYLAYPIHSPISHHLPPSEYTAAVAAQGGLGFIAHPYEEGSRFLGQNRYTWDDWSVTEFTGMEVWNYFSQWVGSCRSLWTTLTALVSWRRAVQGPYRQTLEQWDHLAQARRIVGIGGMDAHGVKARLLGLTLVLHPYRRAFRAVRTHLLLPNPFTRDVATDRQMVIDALRSGSCFFANHEEGDPKGFTFVGRCNGEWILMGEEISHPGDGQVWFSVSMPYRQRDKPTLRLMRNGAVLAETIDCDLQAKDQGPGVYRVEVWAKERGWIFSNPIYLRG